jgi:ribosomal protein S8
MLVIKKSPTVLGNLGIAILSTSKKVLLIRTTSQNSLGIGGEVICYIW